MGLFRISRELQFGICNHDEPHSSQGKENAFTEGETEVGRAVINKESLAFHWQVLARKEESLYSIVNVHNDTELYT